ncbi:DUF1146 domain-containing protein [Paenibacillaceae bacterium]|nr:DUF1146 domain-containing protein [Paenibacillaceae bacterium]
MASMQSITNAAGMSGLLSIVVTLLSITFAWYIIQEIKMDSFVKRPKSPQARMLQLLLSVVLGHGFARFILDYMDWTRMLRWLVE